MKGTYVSEKTKITWQKMYDNCVSTGVISELFETDVSTVRKYLDKTKMRTQHQAVRLHYAGSMWKDEGGGYAPVPGKLREYFQHDYDRGCTIKMIAEDYGVSEEITWNKLDPAKMRATDDHNTYEYRLQSGYDIGYNVEQLAFIFKESPLRVFRALDYNKMREGDHKPPPYKYTEEILKEFEWLHRAGFSLKEIGEHYDLCGGSIRPKLLERISKEKREYFQTLYDQGVGTFDIARDNDVTEWAVRGTLDPEKMRTIEEEIELYYENHNKDIDQKVSLQSDWRSLVSELGYTLEE